VKFFSILKVISASVCEVCEFHTKTKYSNLVHGVNIITTLETRIGRFSMDGIAKFLNFLFSLKKYQVNINLRHIINQLSSDSESLPGTRTLPN